MQRSESEKHDHARGSVQPAPRRMGLRSALPRLFSTAWPFLISTVVLYVLLTERQRHLNSPSQLKLGTFNIRYDGQSAHPVPIPPREERHNAVTQRAGELPWSQRRYKVADAVLWEELDVVGFQEALTNQVEDLQTLLGKEYSWVGVGRDNGRKAGEYVPIYYRPSRLALLSVRHFWLSETPDIPGSISWDAGQTRMVTLAHFQFRSRSSRFCWTMPSFFLSQSLVSKEDFYVLNTHWDDRGVQSRAESASLIVQKVNELVKSEQAEGKLVVLLGDLNSPADEEGYQRLTGHRYNSSSAHSASPATFVDSRQSLSHSRLSGIFGEHSTFTGFADPPENKVIDFVMAFDNGAIKNGSWRVGSLGVIPNEFVSDHSKGRSSDHRMVVAKFERV